MAKIKDFPSDDEIMSDYIYGREIKYISDYNEDTNRDIVDVTEIQKYLAGIKEGCCI